MITSIAIIVFAYLLGAIPCGLLIVRMGRPDVDIRSQGSGNIGATNVRRTAGNRLGAITLLADIAKGALPVALALLQPSSTSEPVVPALTAAAAVVGHMFPIYLRFHGGKGVATTIGAFLVAAPCAMGAFLLIFFMTVMLRRQVSAASLAASFFLPVAVWHATEAASLTAAAGLVALLIWIKHADNLRRIRNGREPRI